MIKAFIKGAIGGAVGIAIVLAIGGTDITDKAAILFIVIFALPAGLANVFIEINDFYDRHH